MFCSVQIWASTEAAAVTEQTFLWVFSQAPVLPKPAQAKLLSAVLGQVLVCELETCELLINFNSHFKE